MTIRRAEFTGFGARDIHLVRGTPGHSLVDRFDVQPVGGATTTLTAHRTAHAAAFEYEFRPTFKATRRNSPTGDVYEGFGIQVGVHSGIVSFLTPTPPLTRHNFIVELRITRNDGGTQNLPPMPIRVHVHPGVRDLRLTPPVLSARLRGIGLRTFRRRFALRAEFTDDVVGDLTDHDGVNWAFPELAAGMFQIIGSLLSFDGAVDFETKVEATWTGAPGRRAEARLKALKPWADESIDRPKIEFVDGHRTTWERISGTPPLNTTIRPENVPNVLFFGAGFKAEDGDAFRGITNKLVHDLKRDPLTRPFDVLATSMNFWRIAPDANIRGGRKILSEVYTAGSGADLKAYPVPPPVRIRQTGDVDWTLSNVIYHLGLPIPAEVSGPGAKSHADLRSEWAVVRTDDLPVLKVSDGVIDAWKLLGTRQFIDVPNEFAIMQAGAPPEAKEESQSPLLLMDSNELEEMREFLRTRVTTTGVAVDGTGELARLGTLWASVEHGSAAIAPANPRIGDSWTDTSGATPVVRRWDGGSWVAAVEWDFDNRSLVVMIAGSKGGRASRSTMIRIALDGGNYGVPVTPVTGVRALALNYTEAPASEVDRDIWRTIAHEIGHSFGLGDEYVDFPESTTSSEADLARSGNLMATDIQPTAIDQIDPANIKWSWLRARKGAVLHQPARLRGGTAGIEIPLLTEYANQFSIGDKLFLRSRRRHAPLSGPLNTGALATRQSSLLTVTDKAVASPPPGEAAYVNLVVSASPAMTAADLAPYGKGAVVFLPLEASSPPAGYGAHQRLVSKRVFEYIRTNNRPLSPEPYNPQTEAQDGGQTHTPPGPTYPLLYSFKNTARIVGLYRGGNRHALGAFHPAGECMMRDNHADKEFCYVCRYVMVDMIDPQKHWEIDRAYDSHYPD